MASSLVAARATSIRGMVLCRRPVPADPELADPELADPEPEPVRRFDGCTRGASPDCFS